MLNSSRRNWAQGKLIRGVVATMAATSPFVLQAQEYLPPVIDRSSSYQEQPSQQPATSSPVAQQRSLEQRLERLERLMESQALVDMLMRLDSIQEEAQTLRGEMELLTHDIEGIKQQQRDLYLDIDRRLRQAELAAKQRAVAPASTPIVASIPGSAVPAVSMTGTPPSAAVVASVPQAATASVEPADPALERQKYQAAFGALKEGRYKDAIAEFQTFLTAYPSGDYTDNAQYWLGEANYVTRQFRVAEQEFLKVLKQHPDSPKVADASLKLGYTYYELGEWDSARNTLSEAAARFPGSTVAKLAQNRLQKMRLEGR
ncbi:tol-pal system protein YbgF [Pseudomonadota bacterium]